LCEPAAFEADVDLERAGARVAAHACEPHVVGTDLRDLCVGDVRHDIGRDVGRWVVHLVQQLLLHGVLVDDAAGAGRLGDRAGAVCIDLGDGVTQPREAGHILDARVGVVAAADLRAAFEQMAGHLLECGAQVSGGYYADPGVKDVPGLARLGYPIAEIDADGACTITKPAGTGGIVDEHTVKEQLLYEVHDPAAYVTPDVVADIADAEVAQIGADHVRLTGVRGHARTGTLKVNVCFESGWLAE